jgi:hypothetical protein
MMVVVPLVSQTAAAGVVVVVVAAVVVVDGVANLEAAGRCDSSRGYIGTGTEVVADGPDEVADDAEVSQLLWHRRQLMTAVFVVGVVVADAVVGLRQTCRQTTTTSDGFVGRASQQV